MSLIFFRSAEGHAPDAVGEEMVGFIRPLLLAIAFALGHAVTAQRVINHSKRKAYLPLLIVLLWGGVEIVCYLMFIM